MSNEKILAALAAEDGEGNRIFRTDNEEAWTSNGAPKMEVIEDIVGDKSITRAMVTEVAPHFSRENPRVPGEKSETEGSDDEQPETEGSDDEQPETEGSDDEQPTNDLQAKRDVASERVDELNVAMVKLQAELSNAQRELDAAEEQLAASRSGRSSQHDIMDFIKSQNDQRAARAEQHQAMMRNLEAVQAPIDAAMSRPQNRPSRPVSGQK